MSPHYKTREVTAGDRRKYNREWARRKREKQLSEKLRTATRCPHRHGTGVCGGALRFTSDRLGRSVTVCDFCERRKAGLCRDCPKPVYGAVRKAIRCESCSEKAKAKQVRQSQERHREEINARARERLAAMSPERKQAELDYKRLWRKANPEKVAASKKRYAQKYGCDKNSGYLEYHRRYNAMLTRQQRKRELAKAAYYRDNPVRPQPVCEGCGDAIPWIPKAGGKTGRPPMRCDNCVSPAELKRRIVCRAKIEEPAPVVKPLVRPIKVKRPQPARYAPTGERLCLTPGCDIVVTHRRKKCTKCRNRITEAARQKLRLGKPAALRECAA